MYNEQLARSLQELVLIFGYHDQRKMSKQLKKDALDRAKRILSNLKENDNAL